MTNKSYCTFSSFSAKGMLHGFLSQVSTVAGSVLALSQQNIFLSIQLFPFSI